MRLYTALFVLLLLSTPIARADDTEITRASLRGLKGVQVIVEEPKPEAEQAGLTKSAIQTDVELKLRQATIPVLATADAYLYVGVNVLPSSDRAIWPYVIIVELHQPVVLTRDPSIFAPGAVTWNVLYWGDVGKQNVRTLRENVKDMVDYFINAYLAVNPKK